MPESGGPAADGREPRRVPEPGSTEETLRRLEQRLDQASAAAERLMAQAAAAAVRAGNPGRGAGNPGPGARDPGPGAGNPGRGAGNPGRGAGNPGPGAGNPGPGAGNPGPGAGNAGPGARDPGPAVGDPGPGAGESYDAGHRPDLPPAGWQSAEESSRGSTSELDPFVALVQAMRDLIPPDLQQRLIAALREVLLALRALIDWYLERLERRREQGVEIQDIPIL
jgi:hypothetical protein